MVSKQPTNKKECSKCFEPKPITEFYPKKTGNGGVTSLCKLCFTETTKVKKTPPPLCYRDYLKKAGLLEYVNRTAKYRL